MELRKQDLKQKIASAPEKLLNEKEEEVLAEFVKKFELKVPELNEAGVTVIDREMDVDVSWDRRRFLSQPGPFYVKGTEITFHVPFTGDGSLFKVQPTTFTLSPPRGEVRGQELLLVYQFPNDTPPVDLKAEFGRDLQKIESYLQNLRSSQSVLRQQLEGEARGAWNRRKSDFEVKGSVLAGLGLPRKETAAAPPVLRPDRKTLEKPSSTERARTKQSNSWHVFISHASEDKKEIAQPLAQALRREGLEVWYDDYTLTIGDSLRQKIDEGLAKSSYGIVILSKAFFAKHWPQQELNGLAAREIGGKKVILPVWHKITRDEVAEISPTLADRLGALTSNGLDDVVAKLLEAMNP